MLFATKLQEINATISNYNQEIEELQRKLEQLREQKKALENHAQQLQSAESASESAFLQVKTALMMVRAIDDSQVETFKAAIDELFADSAKLAELLPSEEDDSHPSDEPEEVEDMEVTEATSELGSDSEVIDINAINETLLTTDQLNKYTSKELSAIATSLGIAVGKLKKDKVKAIANYGITITQVKNVFHH